MTNDGRAGAARSGQCRAFLLLVTLASGAAWAQASYIKGPPPTDRLFYRNTSVLRANPIGLINEFRMGYRHGLFDSDSPLLQNAFVGVQAIPTVSPAFARMGVAAEFAPLSILQFSGMYELIGNFGRFGTVQSFQSANSDASATHMVGPIPDGANYGNTGQQLTLGALFQLKFPTPLDLPGLVVRNNYRAMYVDQALQNGDRVYYDLIFDLVVPGRGWFSVNDLDVLYMFSPKLTAGIR
jgi:hypothetical protein